ncbi:DUF350 domain-containing protein [Gordonia otitidis]|nr:DUF350 domain-containing protein [Gordonia otitidis]UEA60440.1 DUF350 domain-containing protein [Gordonia otitidis]
MDAVFGDNLAWGASFSIMGVALLVVGFGALDLVTPGRLRQLVWVDNNRNAMILTTSMVVGISFVLVASVVDTAGMVLWKALLYSLAYVVLTIAVMMWSFVLIDWLTPGKLGTILLENDTHPAGWISAAVFVGVAAVFSTVLIV